LAPITIFKGYAFSFFLIAVWRIGSRGYSHGSVTPGVLQSIDWGLDSGMRDRYCSIGNLPNGSFRRVRASDDDGAAAPRAGGGGGGSYHPPAGSEDRFRYRPHGVRVGSA